MKRIIMCADGTWNRPEEDLSKDFPTNVLKIARAISPMARDSVPQVVFYDWGLGSYHDNVTGGAFGAGIDKNIADHYRFIVQNYHAGDELYFFGFSRGAYTVRSLAGLMNNCGILKREYASRIQQAYDVYKNPERHPDDAFSVAFRKKYAGGEKRQIHFIGVWDTVGALGIPLRMLGFLNEKHVFYDTKIGPNISIARHALSIDELRKDFAATIWKPRSGMDLQQVWFPGVHADIGGGYPPGPEGESLSDIALQWMIQQAQTAGLEFESHLIRAMKPVVTAEKHNEYSGFFKLMGSKERTILKSTDLHISAQQRYQTNSKYRPENLEKFVDKYGWVNLVE